LADDRGPGRCVNGKAGSDEKHATKNEIRIENPEPAEHRQDEGREGHPDIDSAYQLLTIDLVGEGAGRQYKQKASQRRHGRHQG
jgi:hypothetical protein